uniref:Mitochondrial import inner membrane translocase subunit TIM14 n=1 Tax=Cyprinus carpio carpio TaxID=630221 RepID=A0A8C1EGH9_CYPCA
MASTMVAVGLTLAAAGFAGRYAMQAMKHMEPQVKLALEASKSAFGSGYYRGGFEPKMTRREASLILGISPTANKNKIREAHRKLMILNHPDRGVLLPAGGVCCHCRLRCALSPHRIYPLSPG